MATHSEALNEIAPAWVAALNELTDITRDNVADTGSYKYRYATLDAATKQAREVLGKHGVAVHQEAHGEGTGSVVISTTAWHVSGQWIAAAPLTMHAKGGPQDVGSAISYGRRYALMTFLGLATDDDDGAGAQKAAKEADKPHPLSERVTAAVADMRRLPDASKEQLRAWADGRSLAPGQLLKDERWLEFVEEWLEQHAAGVQS